MMGLNFSIFNLKFEVIELSLPSTGEQISFINMDVANVIGPLMKSGSVTNLAGVVNCETVDS